MSAILIQEPRSLACPWPPQTVPWGSSVGLWRTRFSWDCAPLSSLLRSLQGTFLCVTVPRHSSWTESTGYGTLSSRHHCRHWASAGTFYCIFLSFAALNTVITFTCHRQTSGTHSLPLLNSRGHK